MAKPIAVVVYDGLPKSLLNVITVVATYDLSPLQIAMVAAPFHLVTGHSDAENEIVTLLVSAIRLQLRSCASKPKTKVFIFASSDDDIPLTGEVAGALPDRSVDVLYFYPGGDPLIPLIESNAKDVYRHQWGLDTRTTHALIKAEIAPERLLHMGQRAIGAIPGINRSSQEAILLARRKILNPEE